MWLWLFQWCFGCSDLASTSRVASTDMAVIGRPPTLSKRYVTTPYILDVDDDTLMGDDLAGVWESLNEYGYNKQGVLYRATL